jgi:hypothetical protein
LIKHRNSFCSKDSYTTFKSSLVKSDNKSTHQKGTKAAIFSRQ